MRKSRRTFLITPKRKKESQREKSEKKQTEIGLGLTEGRQVMKLWRRASGVLKDTNSVIAANLTRRSSVRNPDVESAIVKATSHDESSLDAYNCQKIYKWIAHSPSAYIPPFAYAITARMDKTRSWVVALKGLILIHGVFCLRVPAVLKFGRLPFDLSGFNDGHDDSIKAWAHSAFVRAYYAFLDQKSSFMAAELKELREKHKRHKHKLSNNDGESKTKLDLDMDLDRTMFHEIERLQSMQSLVDMLMQIKPPQTNQMVKYVVREAMDCCLTEIYDIYGRICFEISKMLTKICSATKLEASLALRVLEKSNLQADELSLYVEYCKGLSILSTTDCPDVKRVPWEDIRKIEQIVVNGALESNNGEVPEVEKAIVVAETVMMKKEETKRESPPPPCDLLTIVTTDWVFFDGERDLLSFEEENKSTNPFVSPPMSPSYHLVPYDSTNKQIPDLISFS